MKKAILAAVCAVALLFTAAPATAIDKPAGPCSEIRWKKSAFHRRQLVRCAAGWAKISYSSFLQVGLRESGVNLFPKAVSWTGCCKGVFQHHDAYWQSRARSLLRQSWFVVPFPTDQRPNRLIFNARANVLAAARMWRNQGGPCPAWC